MSQRIALIVSHPKRDLPGMVLLAAELARRGSTCFIVPTDLMVQEIFSLAPDLILLPARAPQVGRPLLPALLRRRHRDRGARPGGHAVRLRVVRGLAGAEGDPRALPRLLLLGPADVGVPDPHRSVPRRAGARDGVSADGLLRVAVEGGGAAGHRGAGPRPRRHRALLLQLRRREPGPLDRRRDAPRARRAPRSREVRELRTEARGR